MQQGEWQRRRARVGDYVRSRIWPIPTLAVAVAVLAGLVLPRADGSLTSHLPDAVVHALFAGDADSARGLMSAIAGSLITVTSLVFSLTVVALQLASSQASPRLLRMFSSNPQVHRTLAIFLATFAYALTVLRSIGGGEIGVREDGVPRLAVSLGFVLSLASIVALILYLAYVATLLRVETMLRDVHREGSKVAERTFAQHAPAGAGDTADADPWQVPEGAHLVPANRSGFITTIDRPRLAALAAEHDLVVGVLAAVGANTVRGVPVLAWWPRAATSVPGSTSLDDLDQQLLACLATGYERTVTDDLDFVVRQLVDVAVKALSPGINDPTTAVHALGHVSALLVEVCSQPLPANRSRDDAGEVRVLWHGIDPARLLEVAMVQPREYGASDLSVALRLLDLLREVAWCNRHADLEPMISDHADAVVGAAADAARTVGETDRLRTAHAAVSAAIAGRW